MSSHDLPAAWWAWSRCAIEDARERAGLQDVSQVHVVETHDCFAMSEYMVIDHLGLTT